MSASQRPRATRADNTVFLRQWTMLCLIPREPDRIRVETLRRRLLELQIDTSARTLQRDLRKLARHLPIVCNERKKPFEWAWAEACDRSVIDSPSAHEAFAHRIAQLHVRSCLRSSPEDSIQQARLDVVARVDAPVATALLEVPLGIDQRLGRADDDGWRLKVSVIDGPAFRGWVLAQGRGLVVEEPVELRESLMATAESILAGYHQPQRGRSRPSLPETNAGEDD